MDQRAAPGIIRDSIINYLTAAENASIAEIRQAIASQLGDEVAASSVRSYLNLNTPDLFERTHAVIIACATRTVTRQRQSPKRSILSAVRPLSRLIALIGCAPATRVRSMPSLLIRPMGCWNIRPLNKLSCAASAVEFGGFPRPLTAISARPYLASQFWTRATAKSCTTFSSSLASSSFVRPCRAPMLS